MKRIRIIRMFLFLASLLTGIPGISQEPVRMPEGRNLAIVAEPTGSFRQGFSMVSLNDGLIPNTTRGQYGGGGNRPRQAPAPQWLQYEWKQPVRTNEISVFWYNFNGSVRLPQSYRVTYWDGNKFSEVKNSQGLGLTNNSFNSTKFDEVETTRLRLEVDSADRFFATVLEWVVFQAPGSPDIPPLASAGVDRSVMINGKTYLKGSYKAVTPPASLAWKKSSGPGAVSFMDAKNIETTATFSAPGDYILTLTIGEGSLASSSSLSVHVTQPPEGDRLDVVYTKRYKINNQLWNSRSRALIVNWIPWCIDQINSTGLKLGPGGIDNFIEAGKALRGEPHGKHLGYVFSNAWVHQTVESMSIALMVDPQGDREIMAAQEKMKATLEKWIPIILAAQEPDGYLQTAYTLRDTTRWKSKWAPETRGNHEGYVAGYFLESAINHYTLTEGSDKRLYNAAKKLADCWVANIGPGKKEWFDGHQEMEQALVRFGRFVNDMEGNGRGDNYINLAKFLLDSRKNGTEYDQSHVPVQQQYEAVGHAVRAVYCYSGMADVAAETGDVDYQSAVLSLWNNIVNRKYYITGGIGSGESSEGFGPEYSLRNSAYCESCSSCGLIFFDYKMNLAYHDAKYADLYEETMYNALLGAIDLDGKNFFYDNPLSTSITRYPWHVCPCCVGNIPRTLLMIPTWTYVKGKDALYVNLFIGSTIKVEKVAGTDVEMIQETDYPWSGKVSITVNPAVSREFTLYIRIPDRSTSQLYTSVPSVKGMKSLSVNGKSVKIVPDKGYAVVKRTWKAGDKVIFELPMEVQIITADRNIEADRGRVALRYGPMIYNVEKADQPDIDKYIGTGLLKAEWDKNLLGGVMAIKGQWSDGSPLTAVPNYARCNRITQPSDRSEPQSVVWIKKE